MIGSSAGIESRVGWSLPPKRSDWEPFVRGLSKRAAQGRIEDALDVLYDRVDDLLLDDQFDRCDGLFASVDVDQVDDTLLLGLLTITHAARERLPHRAEFYQRVRDRVLRTSPTEAERLLRGLE